VFEIDGGPKTLTEDTILHIPALGYDGLRGLSPIAKARQEIGGAMARQKYPGVASTARREHVGRHRAAEGRAEVERRTREQVQGVAVLV
jgi:hypothetical protein